jgi:20S proteasome alpha/beta subunit
MTVGIALIADSGRSVVVVADKQVTMTSPGIAWDGRSKICTMRDNIMMCYAGTTSHCREIFRLCDARLKKKSSIVSEVVCEAYRDQRFEYITKKKLYDFGISSLTELHESYLPDERKEELITAIANYDHDQSILLAQIVDGTAKVGIIIEPGRYRNRSETGIGIIGSPTQQVYYFLVRNGFNNFMPALEALSLALLAKKYVESDPYVGPGTDAAILTRDGVRHIPTGELEALEPAHGEYVESVRAAQDVFRGRVVVEFEEA